MDILIPAALEGQITRERAEKLTCKLVLEGANGPTYPEADDVLPNAASSWFLTLSVTPAA